MSLVVLVTVLGTVAAAPTVTDLLQTLHLASYAEGTTPPSFNGYTTEGRPVSLAGLRGTVILLSFWATWCLPCRDEMAMFEQLHRDLAANGLTVLGVNVQEATSDVQKYADGLGLSFSLLLDPNGEIQRSYGVVGLPTTFLVGRDGRAVGRAIGPRNWGSTQARALIQALLAEPAIVRGAR